MSLVLVFLAGALTSLSPCVLPLAPVLVGAAAATHQFGPAALAVGLAASFSVVGTFVATLGTIVGLEQSAVQAVAAGAMLVFGVLMASPSLHHRFSARLAGAAGVGGSLLGRLQPQGWHGQFVVGLLLGLVWSPCIGPTLGSAVSLASQGGSTAYVAASMVAFGIGAALPLLVVGALSRTLLSRWRGRLLALGDAGQRAMGWAMAALGVAILVGADKTVERWATRAAPEWLVRLTTSL
ncbi:MAG: cytochrome c biogenesis protein CcdA [Deltaproteobacteria bacterium]|nr:cytochrome c biogenesis protein CcdA [Deltaproteobacteria bacterium]